jgi:hypothetical protein
MPTILRYKGFRFHFYSNEGHEPPHVHIRRAHDSCKFWLNPVALAYNDGMRSSELRELERVVQEHRDEFESRWHEYFG